jgi:hypothetical protein
VYTTPAIVELHERLAKTAREHPESVQLLAYRPGGRLEALDTIALMFGPGSSAAAIAPGRAAAASFEAVTGIETTAVGERWQSRDWTGDVVVAEAQRMGPWELSSVVESSLAAGCRVVLFAPSAALDGRFTAAAHLAPHLAPFARPDGSDPPRVRGGAASVAERYFFAGREVLVVADGPAAREALLTAWRQGRASGQRPLLVASDDAVVASLRASVRDAGGSLDDVVDGRRLATRLAAWRARSGPPSQLVVLGTLPNGAGAVAPSECVQVAIVPAQCQPGERLGRAAEVARPRYLVSELGAVRSSASDRSAWRAAATVIESFRHRFAIDDHEHAIGDPVTLRSPDRARDAADTRLELRRTLRKMDREAPSMGRRTPGSQGLSR